MYQEWFEKYKEITNESKADEMFKRLGYEKEENDIETKYHLCCSHIIFNKVSKYVISQANEWGNDEPEYIDMQELKAINEKCKELGWLDVQQSYLSIL